MTHFTPSYSYSVMTHAWLVQIVMLCKNYKIQEAIIFFSTPPFFGEKRVEVRGNNEKGKRNRIEANKK